MIAPAAQLALPTPLAEAHAGWPFITVISQGGHVHRSQAENIDYRDGKLCSFRWYTSWAYSELATADCENLSWCRGWHERDSPEVKAMFVARGLT